MPKSPAISNPTHYPEGPASFLVWILAKTLYFMCRRPKLFGKFLGGLRMILLYWRLFRSQLGILTPIRFDAPLGYCKRVKTVRFWHPFGFCWELLGVFGSGGHLRLPDFKAILLARQNRTNSEHPARLLSNLLLRVFPKSRKAKPIESK